ncbi:hypothetical protein M9Y10_030197 [Tritrichomonas musculus]|uniref:Serine/threonine-protein phosphatase n=1 Tax=Tritrichomonas musculus TaxID=1915356 RepID=A0ABR2KP52_9EUKA
MSKIASYIFNAYSFITGQTTEELLNTGFQLRNSNPIPSFDEKSLLDLCSEAQKIFEKENNVLEINGDVIIVGDIHGSLHDLLRIIKFIQENDSKVLFLGDYVDRGEFSLECITILLTLKTLYPDSYYLIRGNHEFNSLCTQYGFKSEILNYHNSGTSLSSQKTPKKLKFAKFQTFSKQLENLNCYKYTESLYKSFINVFSYLPIGAVINNTTFCIHGGLSPNLNTINDLNTIKRPVNFFKESPLLTDLLWSDPSQDSNILFDKNQRGQGCSFNNEAVEIFLKNTSLSRIIRAHQCVKRGFYKNFNNKCITVFSASSFNESMENSSSVLQIFQEDDKIKVTTFLPLKRLHRCEAVHYKVKTLESEI